MSARGIELIEQYRRVHARQRYGMTSVKNLRFIRPEIRLLKPRSILDYGCGQSALLDALRLGYPVELLRYDPAIPAFVDPPTVTVDLLINIDVLEHIPEADLDEVIAHMASLCRQAIVIVDTGPAGRSCRAARTPTARCIRTSGGRNAFPATFRRSSRSASAAAAAPLSAPGAGNPAMR